MLANYFYFHFHFYAHSRAEREAGRGRTIDAVYEAIYDDSTFLFQPQWDRRNLNLLHDAAWGKERERENEIKTKQLLGGKNNAKAAENVVESRQPGQIKLRRVERIGFLLSLENVATSRSRKVCTHNLK